MFKGKYITTSMVKFFYNIISTYANKHKKNKYLGNRTTTYS